MGKGSVDINVQCIVNVRSEAENKILKEPKIRLGWVPINLKFLFFGGCYPWVHERIGYPKFGQPRHTASFWNIIIQWTSPDDLTEK